MDEYFSCLEVLAQEYDCIAVYDLIEDKLNLMRVSGLLREVLTDMCDEGLSAMVNSLSDKVISETDSKAFRDCLDREVIAAIVTEESPYYVRDYVAGDGLNSVRVKIIWRDSGSRIITLEYKQHVTEEIREYMMLDCFTDSGMVIMN